MAAQGQITGKNEQEPRVHGGKPEGIRFQLQVEEPALALCAGQFEKRPDDHRPVKNYDSGNRF